MQAWKASLLLPQSALRVSGKLSRLRGVVIVLVFVLVIVAIVGSIWALRRLLLAWGIAW